MKTLGLVLQIRGLRSSQYQEWNFDSLFELDGKIYGVNSSGIYECGCGDLDDAANIDASFALPVGNQKNSAEKRIRKGYVTGELYGKIDFKITHAEGNEKSYRINPRNSKQLVHGVSIGSDNRSSHTSLEISNVDGADFSINMLEALMLSVGRRWRNG